jgi:hypothetical protein
LQERFRISVAVVLADTTGFSAARDLLAEGTGDFGENSTALPENGEGREANDNRFDRPRATCNHGTTIEKNTRADPMRWNGAYPPRLTAAAAAASTPIAGMRQRCLYAIFSVSKPTRASVRKYCGYGREKRAKSDAVEQYVQSCRTSCPNLIESVKRGD